jgi:nucleotide-binding universal stress UspA family protein
MRSYLVVVDESQEAQAALRFAARRAARTGGTVDILALIPQQDFVQWGGVQAAIEEEARLRAEAAVAQASGAIIEEAGVRPSVTVKQGDPVKAVMEMFEEGRDVSAFVVGAAVDGEPGPLVTYFLSNAGALPCPMMIVPGHLDAEALDRLS